MTHQNHVDEEIYIPNRVRDRARQLGLTDMQILQAASAGLRPDEDGEARVPVEPTDLDYRTAALHSAVLWLSSPKTTGRFWPTVAEFEEYLRGEAA